jgi:NAD+ synthase (glutamine-hydrolysing)
MRQVRIGLAQINVTVGDLSNNTKKIISYIHKAKDEGVDIVTFPELAITGYPPQDLLLKPQFLKDNLACLQEIIKTTQNIGVVVGFVDREDDIYNAAAVIHNGKLLGVHHKVYLPNYGVFDENRYFQSGVHTQVFQIQDCTFGVNVCEDIWYPGGPTSLQALNGAELILNISASPYYVGKPLYREQMMSVRAADSVVAIAYNNLVGGQDRLIFDGCSLVVNQTGHVLARGKLFEEDFIIADINLDDVVRTKLNDSRHRKEVLNSKLSGEPPLPKIVSIHLPPESAKPVEKKTTPTVNPFLPKVSTYLYNPYKEVYDALTLGVRDYVRKNGFKKVVIGLSGGIDSALTATIAVDALGKENVIGVSMPGQYSSQGSLDDAKQLVQNLGIEYRIISIQTAFEAYLKTLADAFKGTQRDVTEENLQARIRGNILMALSNKFGYLVLTTGNKSEVSVGYATLYGDMAGGLAIISDVPKTMVYALSEYRNAMAGYDLIPKNTITKAPSAELRENQKDSDSLPEYGILDGILHAYVEEDKSLEEIVALGYDEKTVLDVVRKVDSSEYKRQQAAPGLKITSKAFGPDRRLPITNKYRG